VLVRRGDDPTIDRRIHGRRPSSSPPVGSSIETGSAFLLPGQTERNGYALYSYLLLRGTPNPENKERYLATFVAFRDEIPIIERLQERIPLSELNITYLPVTSRIARSAPLESWLDAYDYVAARDLLRVVNDAARDGPYIVSYDRPLSRVGQGLGREDLLFQDLSWVPPSLVLVWVKEFMRQASKPGAFAKEDPWRQFVLRLRTGIEVAAQGLPEVEKAWGEAQEGWGRAVKPVKVTP
jgi:hypothetical protein